ncbi:hypothetical protein PIB30_061623 [Stylosanthes scabra]|uniref:Uncharacterized protein n=1 Tax=Stylosanthes scabra TaxID=79078 RepID=A0ABU6QMQ3_9FABA|nr:hypothetical protein [Stylosanthes scabra]
MFCRWTGRRGHNDYNEARLVRYRERLDLLNIDDESIRCSSRFLSVDRVLRQFGGKQSLPSHPLNIDIFHKQSARNDDEWWPSRLREWFVVWNNRRANEHRLVIDPAISLHPSRQYF